MINFLRGTIADMDASTLIIDVGGVGYELLVTSATLSKACEIGNKMTVFTHMSVREDAVTLFGFHNKQEKDMFLKLTSISGIGPKMAIAILSGLGADELISAIATGNNARLSGIKGVGKKTAERIVLELKDKVGCEGLTVVGDAQQINPPQEEAILALTSMGFTRQEATSAVSGVKGSEKMSVEEIILASLKGR